MRSNTPVIPGYKVSEQLYAGSKSVVYRAIRERDSIQVVIKLLASEYPSFNELLQFRNQYIISKNLNLNGIIRPLSLEVYENGYILVMEDTGGVSLREYIKTNTLSLVEFLTLAIQLTDILQGLQHNRVIHKDIKPANILIHPETKQVQLIDFSIASLLPRETQEIKSPNVLEGTLAYISPEQTGRMNRGIDYRSDFYSLGVTFYELLTGELPFISNDPMELVHCHIAQLPACVSDVTEIPQVISKMIIKLMAKNAEDRYQSALGLKHDLENCLCQLKNTGEITYFEIGTQDLCELFLIPEKLYGREAEVKALLEAFNRVADNPKSEMMLVAGFSGIGKTAVVSSVHKPITRSNGYFIKGKFDQFNRNIPLSAFVQALRDLMGQLLSESDVQLQEWRSLILEAVGENGQVLIEVIPELERVIGKQQSVLELSGTAAQNRFNLLLRNFTEVFTTKEHPLVMFLDDLQWADSASLQLIKLLMRDNGYLFLLGAYRDNEVSPAHPFMLMVEELIKSEVTVNTITLAPLAFDDTLQLVADTLHCSTSSARPLTELIERKTQGNPFFSTQFLKALYEDGHIKFNEGIKGGWECDIAQINTLSLTEDVVEFMAQQLQKLPTETQEILKLAACIGNKFDLDTLAIVSEQSEASTAAVLWKALQEGMILPQSQVYKFYLSDEVNTNINNIKNVGYRFLHDRVQQAAYSLIPDDQKQTTHYHIGQLLRQKISPEAIEDYIFDVINQLNYGTCLITEQTERDELARLNLIACHKAKTATAYQAAREYATTGLSLLGENAWQRQYKMCISFHNDLTELAALSGDFETMEQLIETVTKHAQSLLEKVCVYRIKILANVSQNKLTEAIAIAEQLLQQLGVTFPEACTPENIQYSIAETEKLIGDREIGALVNLPRMTDALKIAIVQIANSIMPAASISGSPLYPLLVCLSVKLSIQYGNALASGYAYVNYGIIACNMKQDVDTGVKFGELALRVVSELDAYSSKPEVLVVSGLFISHRKSHIKETLPLLQEGYAVALEVGNHEAAGYSGHTFCLNSFWCGQPLTTLEQDTGAFCNGLVQLNQLTTANWCRIYWQSILNLLGGVEHPSILSGEVLTETEFLPLLISCHDFSGLCLFYLYKLMLCYLFGEIESAQNHAVEIRRCLMAAAGSVSEPVFYFYDSLTALATSTSEETLEALLRRVEQNQTQLSHWAHYAPMNHQHKVDLVEAEKCRVLGQTTKAIELYDKAISGAKVNGYIQEEALANELGALFYLDWGKEKVAAGYMQEAYYCYARWSGKAKTDDLEKRYPQLLKPILQQQRLNLNPLETIATVARSSISTSTCTTTGSTSISDVLDFTSVLKAAQAISSSIDVDELITTVTKIILENSGALKTVLILPEENIWQVRAITFINHENKQPGEIKSILTSESIDKSEYIPRKIINYVKNTQKTIVIDNCQTDISGVIGEYMLKHKPKSVLCTPIINQGNLMGILYLENQITSSVFTKNKLEVINLLSSQAAISLLNARLYQQATEALQDLQQAQLQIVQSEKMSALGNLVAGVAHEMNNPLGFIAATLKQTQPAIADISEHLKLYQEITNVDDDKIIDHAESIDLDYTLSDLPKMVDAMVMACDRLKNISTSLRTFSRADKDYKVPFNIHEGIDSTILILKHRLKANEQRPAIEVITEYGNLPQIECFPGQLNQAFMNILANAIDALEESNTGRSFESIKTNPNKITIKTSVENNNLKISIADNGKGMSEEVQQKIFDHLFTTKGVGKGTGLGLAIAKQIVEEKHGGKLSCNSVFGEGTEFVIMLSQ